MTPTMDDVDTKQQEEITALQKKDIAHDTELRWMTFAIRLIGYAFVMWIIASSTLIFVLIDKLDKAYK